MYVHTPVTLLYQVYSAELVGLVAFLGLGHDEHDHRGAPGRRLCRSDTFGPPAAFSALLSSSTKNSKDKIRDKQRPDLVESAIGEAFEASLGLGGGTGGGRLMPSTSGPQRFAGRHRSGVVFGAAMLPREKNNMAEPRLDVDRGPHLSGSVYHSRTRDLMGI